MSIHSLLRPQQKQWRRETKHGLELASLYNEYTKKDGEFRRADRRWREDEQRQRLDHKLNEEQRKRIEREKLTNVAALLERNREVEKKKKYYFDARTKRWIETEQKENDRKINLAIKIDRAKKQTHKEFEKVRKEAETKNENALNYKVTQATKTKTQMKQRDDNYKNEIETMKKRALTIKKQEEKSRENTNNAVKATRMRHDRQMQQNLKQFHEQERKHEDDQLALEAKMNKLSKQNKKGLLSETRRNFRIEAERRSHLTKTRVISTLRWKRKYYTSLKVKMSVMSKKRDIEFIESMENIAEVTVQTRKRERRKFKRKQQSREKERKDTIGNIVRRIKYMNTGRKKATINIIKRIRRIRRKIGKRTPKDVVQNIHERIDEVSVKSKEDFQHGIRGLKNIQKMREEKEKQRTQILDNMKQRVNEICARNPKYMAKIIEERKSLKSHGDYVTGNRDISDKVSEWSSEQHDEDENAQSEIEIALRKFEMKTRHRERKKIQKAHRKSLGKIVASPRKGVEKA